MSDSQSPNEKQDHLVPKSADKVEQNNATPPPKDYYYDDSTGYEVYDSQDEASEDVGDADRKTV
ncbi:MAG TPA: hypothetical protein VHD88_08210 [Pyrinomonadaceae bacterium]|nr:hypothetical protein [Pyrinomonadaceae bacterium]